MQRLAAESEVRAASRQIEEDDLQAWVDGRLTPEDAEAVETYFTAHPEVRERWSQYAEQREEFTLMLADKLWTQKPQKYHARSLGMLRAKYAAVADKAALDPVLEAAGCLAGLRN